MARPREVLHHVLRSMALPYAPNRNVSDTQPRYVAGSNTVIDSDGTLTRRPGTTTHTTDDFGSGNTVERVFHWRAWDGSHFIFANVITSSSSLVYKQKVGTDTTFTNIYTSNDTEPFDFVVANNAVFYGNGTDMRKYDGTNEQKWGIAAPTVTPTTTNSAAGSVPAAIGHRYLYTFGNSTTSHVSDISPLSAQITTANRQWSITGSGSADGQVDRIHVYRTEDGGSTYYELPSSPISNPGAATFTYNTDNATDDELTSTQAPVVSNNLPPTAGYGMEFFANRIWWFKDDTLYYTGFEEINNGREEESAPTINTRKYGQEITGLAAVSQFLLIFTRNGIWRISGDTLSTFRTEPLSPTDGVHQRAAVDSAGEIAAWLDTANVVRVSNGIETQEISFPIRTDIDAITHSNADLKFYDNGIRHWLVLMDGSANVLRVYDFDHNVWNTPWSLTTPTGLGVGQTADGTHRMFVGVTDGSTNAVRILNESTLTDSGTAFTASFTTSLFDVAPADNPMMRGHLNHVILERNTVSYSDVSRLFDEDPKTGTFTALTSNQKDPPNRVAGSTLVEDWFDDLAASGRRVALRMNWSATGSAFRVYSVSLGYRVDDR